MKALLYSILFLLAPCNSLKQSNSSKKDNSKVVIIYQCGACFGRCPEYILTLNGEKKMATFKGIKNTEKIGIYTKKISDAELTDFVSTFEKAQFNSFENEYLGNITDFPIKAISFTNNGSTKLVKERSGAPESLISLEKKLQAYAENADSWIKSKDEDH
jgi:ferredoxin